MENLYAPNSIRTRSGLYVDVLNPTPDMFSIEDIAHALSNTCRFAGHLPVFYSVAQHSVFCSGLVPEKHKLAALMHDASEAYLVDVPRPIKHLLKGYKEIEDSIMRVIAKKFEFEYPLNKVVKTADEIMLNAEWDQLMIPNGIKLYGTDCYRPDLAKEQFLSVFHEITKVKPTVLAQ